MTISDIQLHFVNWWSVLFVVLLLFGFIGWVSYISWTQRRIVRDMVTKGDLEVEFNRFRTQIEDEYFREEDTQK